MFDSMDERAEFIDLVAQAVIDKIEERERINGLANLIVQRVLALQSEESNFEVPIDDDSARETHA